MIDRSLQVLLVEDSPADALLVEVALEETVPPVSLVHATRLNEAIEALAKQEFDIVFLDLGLPDSQGLGSLERIHAVAPQVPIIALTGLSDEEIAIDALQSGASDYLIKGQAGSALLERSMRYAIERKKTENQRIELMRAQSAQQEAEAANTAKDEFLATLSHELRTPLNAILGWASLLRTQEMDSETRQKAYDTIERSARVQAQLIDDLLDVSRIITGKLSLQQNPLDVSEVARNTLDNLHLQLVAGELQLDHDLQPNCFVCGDAVRLQQIMWNLLTNAVKFTPAQGTITVKVQRNEAAKEIIFSVRDSGQGIDATFLPHVFDRFRQADGSTTRRHGGLGLGLSIVRHLAQSHRGRVDAHSDGAGKGAIFQLFLPAIEDSSECTITPVQRATDATANTNTRSANAASANAASPRFTSAGANSMGASSAAAQSRQTLLLGYKILAIDDQADARAIVQSALRVCGAHIKMAASAYEALQIVQSWLPDIIVSDVGMPDMDGYELMRRIRELPPESGGTIPSIALTGYSRAEERERALAAGFQTFLSKPIDTQLLTQTIADLLKRG